MPELPMIPPGGSVSLNGFPRPPVAPGAASEALKGAGDAVEDMATEIGARLNDIRRTTQFNLAESDYRSQADDISYKILRDPSLRSDPDKARVALQSQLAPIQSQLRKQYPAADWDGMLTRNMTIWGDARTRVIGHAAIGNLEQDTKDEIKAQTPRAIADALTLSDPADRQKAVTDHLQLISVAQRGGLMTKGEADLERATFSYQLGKGQFEQQARANPGQILTMSKAPEGIPPEWLDDAKKLAREQMDSGERNAAATYDALKGNIANAALRDAANGTLTPEKMNMYSRLGLSTSDIRGLPGGAGFTPAAIDEPVTRDRLKAQVQNDPLAMTADDIREYTKGPNPTLSPATALQLQSDLIKNQRFTRTAIGSAARQMKDVLKDELFPITSSTFAMPGSRAKYQQQVKDFSDNWEASVKEETSLKGLYSLAKQFREAHTPKLGTPPPPMLPRESPVDYLGRLDALGFDSEKMRALLLNPAKPKSGGGLATSIVGPGGGAEGGM